MTLLSKNELSTLIPGTSLLVENMIDPDLQTQPNGVEMTLKQVEKLTGAGTVDYDNSKRVIPNSEIIEFDSEEWKTRINYKTTLSNKNNIES